MNYFIGLKAKLALSFSVILTVGCVKPTPPPSLSGDGGQQNGEEQDGGQQNGGQPDAGETGQREVPKQTPETQPGFLVVGPDGLVLSPGQTTQLWARVYESTGAEVANVAPTYTSENPDLATVNADGVVTAVAQGFAEIRIATANHGVRRLGLTVDESVPSGPTAIEFQPPLAAVQVGQQMLIGWRLTDAAGNETAGTPAFTVAGAGAAMDAAGMLSASSPGVSHVRASVNGNELSGELVVVSSDDAPSTLPVGDGSGCGEWEVLICGFVNPPEIFTRPGQSELLQVGIVRSRGCDASGSRFSETIYTEAAPAEIEIWGESAVALSTDGLLTATAPGFASVVAFYDGAYCDCAGVEVLPNLEGFWGASCSNGDTGELDLSWPNEVFHAGLPTYGTSRVNASGSASFCNVSDGFSCAETMDLSGSLIWGDGNVDLCVPDGQNPRTYLGRGSCEELGSCQGPSMEHCAGGRHNVPSVVTASQSEILGPDSFRIGDCVYSRDGQGVAEGCCPDLEGDWNATTYGEIYADSVSDSCGCRDEGENTVLTTISNQTESSFTLTAAGMTIEATLTDCVNATWTAAAGILSNTTTGVFTADTFTGQSEVTVNSCMFSTPTPFTCTNDVLWERVP
jgi:hypothetical protein